MKKDNTLVILTTSNLRQSKLNNRLLEDLSLGTEIITLCDNEREGGIGSGGALLSALENYYHTYKKIIVINSGGYSKRIVNYSVRGKVFTNLVYNSEQKTLLECIIKNALKISRSFNEGVLVCCSDILLDNVNLNSRLCGNTGFCIPADYVSASRHGVMVADREGKLTDYLHKKPVEVLKKYNSTGFDNALLDTGTVFLDAQTVNTLLAFCGSGIVEYLRASGKQLCLYADIVYLLSENIRLDVYLDGACGELCRYKRELYNLLSEFSLRVCVLKDNSFIHFGTLGESLININKLNDGGSNYFNSYCERPGFVGEGTVLDNAFIGGNSKIGKNCLISDVVLHDAEIGDNTSVCGVKLNDGSFVSIVCSVFENPKTVENGTSVWEKPQFYKASSFDRSYKLFVEKSQARKYSIKYCLENANYDFYITLKSYITTKIEQIKEKKYLEYREKIISSHFKNLPEFNLSHFHKTAVKIKLPVRVNLSGTWTDCMPYCVDNGGEMINMAVLTDGEMPITVTLERISSRQIVLSDSEKSEIYDENEINELSDFNLHRSVLRTLGIKNSLLISGGFRLTTSVSGIDSGSGLGISSAVIAGCIAAHGAMFGRELKKEDIISFVFAAEQIMGTGGGWQDQVGVMYPGIKRSFSQSGIDQRVNVNVLEPKKRILRLINEKSILIPTGIEHFGKSMVSSVSERYLSKNRECIEAFSEMKKLNASLEKSIIDDDERLFLNCINAHNSLLGAVSQRAHTAGTDEVARAVKPYTDALSLCGAGGGGYFYAVLKDDVEREEFKNVFAHLFPEIKSAVKAVTLYQGHIRERKS